MTSVKVEFCPVTHVVWNTVEFKSEVWAGMETWGLSKAEERIMWYGERREGGSKINIH